MYHDDSNTALYNKINAEQERYKSELLTKSPQEILEHAYEFALREDILFSFEVNDLRDDRAEALLNCDTPLNDIVQTIENLETSYMDMVRDGIERHADEVIVAQCADIQEGQKRVPLYLHDADYARQNGELEQYRASFQANVACRDAIDAAIREHYHDSRLESEAVSQVVEQFGMDRTLHVLAATARHKDWDQRISHENKVWAFSMPDPDPSDRSVYYVVHQSHPGLVSNFMKQAREMEEKQLRPSVKEQLKAARVAHGSKKAAPREPER